MPSSPGMGRPALCSPVPSSPVPSSPVLCNPERGPRPLRLVSRNPGPDSRSRSSRRRCRPSLCSRSLCSRSLCSRSLCSRSLCSPSLCSPSLCSPRLCSPRLCSPKRGSLTLRSPRLSSRAPGSPGRPPGRARQDALPAGTRASGREASTQWSTSGCNRRPGRVMASRGLCHRRRPVSALCSTICMCG